MKHHIEAVVNIPICTMCGYRTITDNILPICYGQKDIEKECCHNYWTVGESSQCNSLAHIEKCFAFDCTSYEFDEVDGFKSKGKTWDIWDIEKLVIDGETIVPDKLTLCWPDDDC